MTSGEFKRILLPCYRRMYAAAFAILRNADDASDVVQDAMSQLWQKHGELKIPEHPEAFCCAAVRNACIDRLRLTSKRYFENVETALNVNEGGETDQRASFEITKAYVKRLLDAFPEKHRQVLMLSFISQLTNDEICEATGESPPNVRQIISRGRLKLREMLST